MALLEWKFVYKVEGWSTLTIYRPVLELSSSRRRYKDN